jgi:hypothetical protein
MYTTKIFSQFPVVAALAPKNQRITRMGQIKSRDDGAVMKRK